jgi:hypothetical protein
VIDENRRGGHRTGQFLLLGSASIEVKCGSAPDAGKGFRLAAESLGVRKRYVVYPGQERFSLGSGVTAAPLPALADELSAQSSASSQGVF